MSRSPCGKAGGRRAVACAINQKVGLSGWFDCAPRSVVAHGAGFRFFPVHTLQHPGVAILKAPLYLDTLWKRRKRAAAVAPLLALADYTNCSYCFYKPPDRHPETKYVGGPEELGWGVAAAAA